MRTTNIIATLRIILAFAIAGPAQAWPAQSSSADTALLRKPALTRRHGRKVEHAMMPSAPTHQRDRDEDPLASMHFE